MRLSLTPLLTLLIFLFFFEKINANHFNHLTFEEASIGFSNQPPVLANIPEQIIEVGGSFPTINLEDYLTEPEGDDIEWSYFYTNTMSNGESVNWNHSSTSPSMTILGQVNIRGEFNDQSGDQLAAFYQGDIKGKADAKFITGYGWYFFLSVKDVTALGTVTFQYFDADQSTIFEVDDSLVFVAGRAHGVFSNPYVMDAGFISVLEEGEPNLGFLYPRVFNSEWTGVDTVYVVAKERSTAESYADTTMIVFRVQGNPLPLDLISFTGDMIQNNTIAKLNWQIANPENVSRYEIQRSDLKDETWMVLGTLSHDDKRLNYYFSDHNPKRGENYYRLKMIDLDDSYTWSPIISLFFDKADIAEVDLFPNPTFSNQSFFVSIDSEISQEVEIQVIGQVGQQIQRFNFVIEEFQQDFPIDIPSLPSGYYIIRIQVGNQIVMKTLIVDGD